MTVGKGKKQEMEHNSGSPPKATLPYIVMHMHGGTGRLALLLKLIYNNKKCCQAQQIHLHCEVSLMTNKLCCVTYSTPAEYVFSSPAVLDPDHRRPVPGWAAPASSSYWLSTRPILLVQLENLINPGLDHQTCNNLDRKCSQQFSIGRRRCRMSTHARQPLY